MRLAYISHYDLIVLRYNRERILPQKTEPIDDLLCIFPGIMHHFHNLSSAVSRMHDLTLAQFRLIQLLAQKEKCTVNEIAHELGIAQ
ncbi:MAG: hypothetical protein DWQ10_15460, partial [Calditrichaeota bacterium]